MVEKQKKIVEVTKVLVFLTNKILFKYRRIWDYKFMVQVYNYTNMHSKKFSGLPMYMIRLHGEMGSHRNIFSIVLICMRDLQRLKKAIDRF